MSVPMLFRFDFGVNDLLHRWIAKVLMFIIGVTAYPGAVDSDVERRADCEQGQFGPPP
jgi:hypothetical protein